MLGSLPLASVSVAAGKFVITIPTQVEVGDVGRPSADVMLGSWTPSQGSNLFDMVNEAVTDESTFIQTSTLGTCELAMNPVAVPGTILSYRASSSSGNGLIVSVLVDGEVIATWAHALTTTDDLYTNALSIQQTEQMALGRVTVQLTST